MNKLTIVGLGPGSKDYLTVSAFEILKKSSIVYARTIKHPVVKYLEINDVKFESFDHYYEESENFEDVYNSIVNDILKKLEEKDIVYAIPGNPFVAETTVEKLLLLAKEKNIEIEIVHGASFIDAIITTLKFDPVYGLKIIDGLKISDMVADVTIDSLIIQVYNKTVASEVKLELMKYYDDEQEIIVVRGAGIKNEEIIKKIPLYELDRIDCLDHLTSVYIKRVEKRTKFFIKDFTDVMKRLRSINGCPWDREQTHESLRKNLIEEAYEVIETIDDGDLCGLEEELGDLLLQIVFHAEIASENGYFDLNDVITGIYEKMVRRHPHVFSDVIVKDSNEVLDNWEEIKNDEKSDHSVSGALMRISKSFPPLLRAEKIQNKLKKVGFEWEDISGAIKKMDEEILELKSEINANNKENALKELGDLLFSVVNVSRYLKIDPSEALNCTNEKVINRFSFVEQEIISKYDDFNGISLKIMDELWKLAKKAENHEENQKNT